MKKTILKQYARLIAAEGGKVQKGQDVIIRASVEQPEFVRMVAELADTIGVRMCVEGVEYDEQLQILKDMKKVQYIQGYYYDKPLTEEAFEKKYL